MERLWLFRWGNHLRFVSTFITTRRKIKAVRINFRASSAIRPNLDTATTRAEDRIDFVDLETQLKKLNMQESGGEEDGGKEEGGGDGGLDENPLG